MKSIFKLHLILLSVSIFAMSCSTFTRAPKSPELSKELILDRDFPDPAVILSTDGFYYAYATQTADENGRMTNLQVARSQDLKSWEYLGEGLPAKPTWASKTQKIWAPHVAYFNNQYTLYYSADPNTLTGLCLAVATSKSPQGPFVDIGKPLLCGKGFVNIDPMLFEDSSSKEAYLFWGSGFGPIKAQKLSEDRRQFAKNSKPIDLIFPNPDKSRENYQRLIEGAWVIQNQGWYYLFFSGDNCCDPDPHYAVMVARSKNLLGPYEQRAPTQDTTSPPSPLLKEDSRWLAPGHNAFLKDDRGDAWIFYHAIDRNNRQLKSKIEGDRNVRRVFLRSRLTFRDGWPVLDL